MLFVRLMFLLAVCGILARTGHTQTTFVVDVGVPGASGQAFRDATSNTTSSAGNRVTTRIHEGDSVQFTWQSSFHNVNPYDPVTHSLPFPGVLVGSTAIMASNWNAVSRSSDYVCTNHPASMIGRVFVFEVARRFDVTAPANVVTGTPFAVTVTAKGQNSADALYGGTIRFSSSDPDPGVHLPPDYTFVAADNGTHTFTGVVLKTANTAATIAVNSSAGGLSGQTTIRVDGSAPRPPQDLRVSP